MDVNGVKIIEGRAGIHLLLLFCCAILLFYFAILLSSFAMSFDIRLKAQPETKNHQDQPEPKHSNDTRILSYCMNRTY